MKVIFSQLNINQMRKIKVKGIWRLIFSDEEKNQAYDEQKVRMSKAEKSILKKLSEKDPQTTPFRKKEVKK
jgi:hypothetical protein